jgi:hypothetical protein
MPREGRAGASTSLSPPLPREMKFDEVNPFAWHLINKKAFTIFDKKKK